MTDIKQVIKDLSDGDIYTIEEIANITNQSIEIVRGVLNDPSINFSEECDGSGCIYIMDIKYDTIVDGLGFRNSVYCAGCNVFCTGCHNPESWYITNGKPISISHLTKILCDSDYDITFTGGEASIQSNAIIKVICNIKKYSDKNIWLYSGHTFEELSENKLNLLKNIDVLVDGKFNLGLKDLNLLFRGSLNQRIINVQQSLREKKIIEKIELYSIEF